MRKVKSLPRKKESRWNGNQPNHRQSHDVGIIERKAASSQERYDKITRRRRKVKPIQRQAGGIPIPSAQGMPCVKPCWRIAGEIYSLNDVLSSPFREKDASPSLRASTQSVAFLGTATAQRRSAWQTNRAGLRRALAVASRCLSGRRDAIAVAPE